MNTFEDYRRLIDLLRDYGCPVRIGFEATGNYHRTLVYQLAMAGFELQLISSVAIARTREALHNSWDKNDPKDAQVILHMLEIGAVQVFYDPLIAQTNDIQELSKTHDIVSQSKTQLWHRILTHYLPLYFPEADRFHRNSPTDWFLAFLEKFPSPHMISALSKEEFISQAWEVVGRKVEKKLLLSDIYETAKDSIGLPIAADSDAIRMFRMVLAEGRSLIRQRDTIEARADELLSNQEDYKLLRSIPGIGPISALTILAEAGDVRRFRHHRQFLKFCGMDLATIQSGMFRGRSKISKYGNARLRRMLWIAANAAVLKQANSFRDKFERYISKDRQNPDLRRKAHTAIAAKMARTVHAVIKSGAPYRPFFEGTSPGGKTSF
jgi:transposase